MNFSTPLNLILYYDQYIKIKKKYVSDGRFIDNVFQLKKRDGVWIIKIMICTNLQHVYNIYTLLKISLKVK